ncbi:MAG: type II CRISPR RNA-guided endonuclease Cas9 [Lentisphaeria bacterium]|nr:type II CRISPR RNA-guided endonuclease Cas9 [Lentisphaeria bacterium]
MAQITLGLDLGITSIGWALIEETGKTRNLLNWGSRIFQAGMDDDVSSGKGVSRCAERRQKRALREQYHRRSERKKQLIDTMITGGLLNAAPDADFFIEVDKRLLDSFPVSMHRQMAHLIPYIYRKSALDRALAPDEVARAIFHLAQRRGYLSNRKKDLKDKDSGIVTAGIGKLQQDIAVTGSRTLGEYFCTVEPETERIRTRYTSRAMYVDEFRKICKAQRAIIPEELEKQLYRAIFYQRPLKSCKNLIGRCRCYPELRRCPYTKTEAQLFRIYTTVCNLRIESSGNIRSLSDTEFNAVVNVLDSFSPLFKKNGKITLAKLQKAVGLAKGEKFTLTNEENEIYGNELKNILFRAFGDKAENMSDTECEKFFNDLASIRKSDTLQSRLRNYWKLPEEKVEDISGISMPDDYCAFSLKALREFLPQLAAGIDLSTLLKLENPRSIQDQYDLLPLVDSWGTELRNPVVHRVLTELRRLVNAIIARYGKPDLIRIELARDLKATNKEREKMTRLNYEREKQRAAIAVEIARETGIQNPSRNDILKVMLAQECNFECPYSGTSFGMKELFDGTMEIEHIIPYSRSFDDSFANKTLCTREYNSLYKRNRTPYEAFAGSDKYEQMLERVKHFKGGFAERKLELFELDKFEPEEFLSRNLNDTRYASKLAMQYLGLLYGGIVDNTGKQRIFAIAGGCTALIRRAWGGNYLLGEGEKVRNDHRHHAIDALTIALTAPDLVRWIANKTPEERKKMRENADFIDNALYQEAKAKLDTAAVSHHVINKMRGELHKATLYGKDFGNGERHSRVAMDSLTVKDLANIVDKVVLRTILNKLNIQDVSEVTDKDLKIFKDPANFPVMKDKKGNIVNTIKKVRVRENKNTRSIGKADGRRDVANGENYILAIFAKLDENGNEIAWEGKVVSLLDAVLRHQKGLPPFEKNRPGMKFKFSLQKGDIVTWEKDGQKSLCIIRGISLPQFSCVKINDARMKKDIKASKQWFQPTVSAAFDGKMQKYNMNIFGELQRAND